MLAVLALALAPAAPVPKAARPTYTLYAVRCVAANGYAPEYHRVGAYVSAEAAVRGYAGYRAAWAYANLPYGGWSGYVVRADPVAVAGRRTVWTSWAEYDVDPYLATRVYPDDGR